MGILYITVPHTGKGLFLNHVCQAAWFSTEDYAMYAKDNSLKELQENLVRLVLSSPASSRSADFSGWDCFWYTLFIFLF